MNRERYTMREWPLCERPREKLLQSGAGSLSDGELLAILLRNGRLGETALDLARGLLLRGGGLAGVGRMSAGELMRIAGIGPAKAGEIIAALEIGRRSRAEAPGEVAQIRGPGDVARQMAPRMEALSCEVFRVLVLDAQNGLKKDVELTRGTLNASLVHPREVFKVAIDSRAAAVIVVHNHPSGNPEPSQEDIATTHQLAEAGRIVGIPLTDHIIVAGRNYVSLAERGQV
jgi:DNA repair protein RadC